MGDHKVKVSKALSWLLRHGAAKEGLELLPGGWAKLDDVLKRPKFKRVTLQDIKEIVASCPKQRFGLKEDSGVYYIKANQGHSIQVEDPELTEVTLEDGVPEVVHGTYYRHWPSIREQGLSRMNRTHIHFAPGLPGDSGVISGMRSSCQLYIWINLPKALADDIKFFKSANNVILCSGNKEGILPLKYFSKVVDKKTGENLL
ncbi:tRNA 2'-phosphotransferase 1-like isoform X2 [Penaeus japonicus]|uniref:tRNA 2'-phosphotransferase 1-like isoform X2 n=1 Tax=Penaeus japonicus TaxID=27405 RepID=UPI001C70E882|nr:tRNA 2'-phosphotransferase 1-like isoform X2 [Penaeus japonicus]